MSLLASVNPEPGESASSAVNWYSVLTLLPSAAERQTRPPEAVIGRAIPYSAPSSPLTTLPTGFDRLKATMVETAGVVWA